MRTFVAIELPAFVKDALERRQRMLQHHLGPKLAALCRWAPTGQFHLTLRFLGEIDESQQCALKSGLSRVATRHSDFLLRLGELGAFPRRSAPGVLWYGVEGEIETLLALQQDIEAVAVGAGLDPERRSFSPHLTVARVDRRAGRAERKSIGARLSTTGPIDPREESWQIASISLMRSHLSPRGARYSQLATFPLGSAPTIEDD